MDKQVKKKVVFVINNLVVGGVERFLSQVLLRFGEDCDILVITVWGSGVLVKQYEASNIPVYFAAGRTLCSNKNPLLKLYFSIIAPVTFLRILYKLKAIRADIVVTTLTQADILGILAAYFTKIPHRIVRQTDVKPLSSIIRLIKQTVINNYATKVIANSQNTKDYVNKFFNFPQNKISVVRDGINVKSFLNTNFPNINITSPTIGFLGRLEEIKGIDIFVDAVCALPKTQKVIIFGDGSLRGAMVEKIKQCQDGNVEFRGEVLDPKEALKEIDILVVPSVSEGFGLVALEGLFARRVVVTADIPTFREIINNEQNGILVNLNNDILLAGALKEIINNPLQLRTLENGTISWVQENSSKYDIDEVAKLYKHEILGD